MKEPFRRRFRSRPQQAMYRALRRAYVGRWDYPELVSLWDARGQRRTASPYIAAFWAGYDHTADVEGIAEEDAPVVVAAWWAGRDCAERDTACGKPEWVPERARNQHRKGT